VHAARLYGAEGRVRFCRLSVYTRQFKPISFEAIKSAYVNPPGAGAPWKTVWGPARFSSDLAGMLGVIIRHPGFFMAILKTAARDLIDTMFHPRRFERLVRRGDVVVSLGAAWGFPGYMKHIAAAKRRHGIAFSTLVYDMIPIEHGEFVEKRHALRFREWLAQTMPHADVALTISNYSRRALLAYAADAGWPPPRVEVLQLGAGLSDMPAAASPRTIDFPDRHVLLVSTIEIRKNHRLLVRVWRRLIERHGADAVPVLIFAGQIGWLVDDLLAELAASNYLGGKIRHLPDLSDAELRQAYRSCLFTVFPSLSEGWGLPIAESLAHGKLCVASNRTSILEVGGDFVDYFDPCDEDDALAKIERALFEPGYLAGREARLRAEYRPRSWTDCVHGLIDKLDQPVAADME